MEIEANDQDTLDLSEFLDSETYNPLTLEDYGIDQSEEDWISYLLESIGYMG